MRYETLVSFEQALEEPTWTAPHFSLLTCSEPAALELAWQALFKTFQRMPRWNARVLCLFDAEALEINTLFEELNTLPFLSPMKLIVLRRAEKLTAAQRKQLETLLTARMQQQENGKTYVVVMSGQAEKKSPLYTSCQNQGLLVDIAIEKGAKGEAIWATWLQKRIQKEGKTIHFPLAKRIVHQLSDLSCLTSECDKLLAYIDERTTITEEDITAVCCLEEPESIWQLSSAITSGNATQALSIMEYLLEGDLSPFALIASLRHQLQTGCRLAELLEANTSSTVIASHFPQLPSYLLQQQSRAAKDYGSFSYRRALSAVTELEFTLKDRPLEPKRFIERLLLTACQRVEPVKIL